MARVLVVDDDPDVLRLLSKVLGVQGHTVFQAADAMKAMDLLNSSMFDLLISDANMPRFSGFELIRTIRNNKRFQRMGIAMLTGLRERKDIEKGIRVGVDDYIVKPIDPVLLTQKIEALFQKKPPMQPAEMEFSAENKASQVHGGFEMRLHTLSEYGLVLRSPFEVPEGLNVNVAGDIFDRMQVPVPPMKVLGCKRIQEFQYEIRVAFLGTNDQFCQKVRAWIHAQAGGVLGKKVS